MKLVLALLLPAVLAQQCTIGQGSTQSCANHIAVIVDSTSYMQTAARSQQLAMFINTYLSQFDFSSQSTMVTMGFYGMSDPSVSWSPVFLFFGQSDPTMICDDWQTLISEQNMNNMGVLPIATALVSLYNTTEMNDWNYDQIVWFTASNDQQDIQLSGSLLSNFPNVNLTVVSMGGGDFSSWTGARVLCTPFPFSNGYEATIQRQACRTAAGSNTCNGAITTPMPTTVRPTGAPTTPVPVNYCPCTPSKIWNDIIIVYDGSNVLPQARFQTMITMLQSMIASLPISQQIGQYTRLGVISYASKVTQIANLTKYGSFIDAISDNWSRDNVEATNVKGGIDLARDWFDSTKQHRPNVRKVIILAASTYREGFDTPITTANTFKDNGGVIMVIGYGDLKGESSDVLKQIASPGYFVDATNQQPNFTSILNLLCLSNCFCPDPYKAVSSAPTGEPAEGCYFLSDLQGLQILAARFCSIENNGTLAVTLDQTQKIFAVSKVRTAVPVWVGLTFDPVLQAWTWADGTPFTDQIESGTGACATIRRTNGFNTAFTQRECAGDAYDYACQATPCSTATYCP
ncbi:unnamed protein product, partial [Mesorhabditis belari]|uniref:VWFA domain-containing protein n=1 Tax=Mesorhabditis belari TaxID=2138241 RepID=A0AAF3EUG2_9BILA